MKNNQNSKKQREGYSMNKLVSFILALALMLSMSISLSGIAFATEGENPVGDSGEETVVSAPITSVDDLLLAIEGAEDGDILYLTQTIFISESADIGDTDKHITLVRGEGFTGVMLSVDVSIGKAVFQNLSIDGSGASVNGGAIEVSGYADFNDVEFENNISGRSSALKISGGNIQITHCAFNNNSGRAGGHMAIDGEVATVFVNDSLFSNGTAQTEGGAISNSATLYLTNCEIKDNRVNNDSDLRFGGAISNSGVCYLNSCAITGNSASIGGGVYTTKALFASDCKFSGNTASCQSNDVCSTSELNISISDSFVSLWGEEYAKWAWYDDKEKSRFNAESNVTANHDLPIIIASDSGSSWLTCAFVEPESEEQPAPDDTPVVPSYPSNPRPSYDSDKPKEEVKEPIRLICGDAVLDTSKTACLLGYGNGTIGEEDSITRAQMAQIIYRLLTDESQKLLCCEESGFADVLAGAWCNEAVSAIAKAGVVQGCGGRYNPDGLLTRAELITILPRFSDVKNSASSFTDIGGHWAEQYINAAVSMGWIPDGDLFFPDRPATRGETVALLNHIFELCRNGQA